MATYTPTQLFRGAASTTNTALFTNTNGQRTVVTSLAVTNTAAAAATSETEPSTCLGREEER